MGGYLSAGVQSVYSTAPADLAINLPSYELNNSPLFF